MRDWSYESCLFGAGVIIGLLLGAVPAHAQECKSPTAALKEVLPAIVKIERDDGGSGSGSYVFEFANESYILTDAHVVKDNRGVAVLAPVRDTRGIAVSKSWRWGTVVAKDDKLDLALVRVPGHAPAVVELEDVHYVPQVGEQVFAIGSPHSVETYATAGLVSIPNTPDEDGDLILTSALAWPGSSGGALFHWKGDRLVMLGVPSLLGQEMRGMGMGGPVMVPLAFEAYSYPVSRIITFLTNAGYARIM